MPSGHSVPIGHSCGPKGREGGARKGRVQACRRRRSQLLASERAESLLLGLGETLSKKLRKFPRARKFKVSSRAYTRVPAATGLATGGWRRRRESQESASASGGTVQSDQRRGASETGTVPTARVHHKEPMGGRGGREPGADGSLGRKGAFGGPTDRRGFQPALAPNSINVSCP